MWRCKQCSSVLSTRSQLLKHYKLKHGHYGQRRSYPCTYYECPCSFKTWNALKTHLSRCHVVLDVSEDPVIFTCLLCPGSVIAACREYFSHVNNHLRRYETVTCMFENCAFQTNIYATFKSHKSRKHANCTVKDFKVGVVKGNVNDEHQLPGEHSTDVEESFSDLNCNNLIEGNAEKENLQDTIIKKFASLLLKLEIFSHVPSSAIDELLDELHFIFTSAAVPILNNIAFDVFRKHNLQIDELLINEITDAISINNPLVKAIGKDGPLASAFKRKQFYKDHFKVVEAVEYILETRSNKTFQYVPLLKSLQQLLTRKDVVDKLVDHHAACSVNPHQYMSFRDGEYHKNNLFFSDENLRISLCLYIDDFEVCNPLGTSRKKHKLCAVYWILGNLPPGSSSTLSSIYLALLCKSDYVKEYGYKKIFEPLLHDIATLEQQGLFIPHLGSFIKGSVQCVVADNLGAHGLAGFVESFSGKYFCRFCTAEHCDIQKQEVKSGAFERRTKEVHQFHVKTAQEKGNKYKMAATLRVILGDDNASKLTLPRGIPDSVEDLKEEIRRQFGVSGNFRLQYRDIEFDNEFVNLTLTSEIKDKCTVKVIYLENEADKFTHHTLPEEVDDSSSLSSAVDTDILSSPESTSSGSSLRSLPWPLNFPIPQFSYEVQIQLERANQAFYNNGTLLSPSTKLKSDILEGLASEIVKYKVYPSSVEFDDVAEALTTKYPCLKEQGSVTGYYGWKISLKYKLANYRTRLRNIGCPELCINAVNEKRGSTSHGPNQVKKPRKAEVNYCPDYPVGETRESLEGERQALLLEVKKKNNQKLIKIKMERTFAYRRREVIEDMPFIAEFKDRWPALFSGSEVNAEFTRITTVPLLSTFMSQLDRYTSQLMRVFKKKGGTAGRSISLIMAALDKNPSVEVQRECVLKAVCLYLNEKPESLIKEHLDVDLHESRDMEQTLLGVYVIRSEGADAADLPEDIGIVVEGCTVLQDLRDVASGIALLLGLIYCLNLSYPKDLKYTFEFLQKVLMDLDGKKLSTKVQVLKNKLCE